MNREPYKVDERNEIDPTTPIHKKIPDGYSERFGDGKPLVHFCRYCPGWVEGAKIRVGYSTGHHALAGHTDITLFCRRCGKEIGRNFLMS